MKPFVIISSTFLCYTSFWIFRHSIFALQYNENPQKQSFLLQNIQIKMAAIVNFLSLLVAMEIAASLSRLHRSPSRETCKFLGKFLTAF